MFNTEDGYPGSTVNTTEINHFFNFSKLQPISNELRY